jgi:uncharacterized protein YacL
VTRIAHVGQVMAEVVRLIVVLVLTATGFAVGPGVDRLLDVGDLETTRLITSVLGALTGYVAGGVTGRALVRGVDTAVQRLERVPAVELVAGAIGAGVGALVGLVLLLPMTLLPYSQLTVPVTLMAALLLTYAGARLGALRGPDLARYVGMRGRLDVRTPSRGAGVKLMDTSALIDARVVEVARAGFLEGTLVVPTFVLHELQALADASDPRRRRLGRRGLETISALQDEGPLAVEISDEDVERYTEVDAKLAELARARQAALLTCDGNLARVAEISGVRVMNLHVLADAVRPPVLPGDRITVRMVKPGREAGQGVGYLDDGTMVVVEAGAGAVGADLEIDVTSIVQSRKGRMLFGAPAEVES